MQGVYQAILDRMEEGVCVVDAGGRITLWNAAAEQITGYRGSDVLGRAAMEVLPDGASDDTAAADRQVYLHHKHGHQLPVILRRTALLDERGADTGCLIFLSAVPGARPAHGGLQLAEGDRDPLTELANRRCVQRHIEPLVAAELKPVGVLFIDVDGFKAVNDRLGHSMGDRVLRMVARTVANGLRQSDWAVRWGGEEFVAVVHAARAEELAEVAERLRTLISSSWVEAAGTRISVTVSIGATMVEPGQSLESAIDRADHLMYESKRAGRNRVTSARPGIVVDLTTS
ncbi:MAG: diguanylate cyclase [Candidatus Nanopelagicales bacterium]